MSNSSTQSNGVDVVDVILKVLLTLTAINMLIAVFVISQQTMSFRTNLSKNISLVGLGKEYQGTNQRIQTFQTVLRQITFASLNDDNLRAKFPEIAMAKQQPHPAPGSPNTAPVAPVSTTSTSTK